MPPAKKSKSAAKSGTVESAVRKVGEALEPVSDAIASGAKAVGKGAKKVATTVGDAVSSAAEAVTGGTETKKKSGGSAKKSAAKKGGSKASSQKADTKAAPSKAAASRPEGDHQEGPRQGSRRPSRGRSGLGEEVELRPEDPGSSALRWKAELSRRSGDTAAPSRRRSRTLERTESSPRRVTSGLAALRPSGPKWGAISGRDFARGRRADVRRGQRERGREPAHDRSGRGLGRARRRRGTLPPRGAAVPGLASTASAVG